MGETAGAVLPLACVSSRKRLEATRNQGAAPARRGIGGLRDVGIGGFLIRGFKVGIWNLCIGFFYWGFGFRIFLWNLGFEYWILLLGFSFVGRLERLGRCLP